MTKLVLYNNYYHLYKELNKKHFVAIIDYHLGPLVNEISEETALSLKEIFPENYTYHGTVMAPFTELQIKSFEDLTFEQLENLVKVNK